jgi:uncharacterized protein with FMN-binding domain
MEMKEKDLLLLALIGILFALIIGCAASTIVGGPVPQGSLKDGIYDGEAKDGPVKALVKITVQNQRIMDIQLIEHRTWKGKKAEDIVLDRIIEEQSTRVDAVAGATVSSRAIMNAVENAVQKAK